MTSKLFDKQFLLYGVIGASGALLDFLLYLLLIHATPLAPAIATFLSVSVAIVSNFFLNSRFNFKTKDHKLFRLANFYAIGIFGAVLSGLIIYSLFNVFGIDPTLSKLLTIIPVVLLQYFLNRKYSFKKLGNAPLSNLNAKSFFRSHWLILTLVGVFAISSLALVKLMPTTGSMSGPDEQVHYQYNVKFILDNHRLPVSGIDDKPLYERCRDNAFGLVACTYSYQVFPPINYIWGAVVSGLAHDMFGFAFDKGVRLAALLWGVIFVIFTYLAVRRITGNNSLSALITAIVGLIPQVIFISSYINQDAHSLAFSAIALYSLVRLLQDKNIVSIIIFGFSVGGLLPQAKYNYFVLFFTIGVVMIWALIKGILKKRQFIEATLSTFGFFFIIAFPWYLRNYILYKDFLGQSFVLAEMSKYHSPGIAHPLLSRNTFSTYVVDLRFFETLFKSFIASFGYMKMYFIDPIYENIRLLFFASVAGGGYIIVNQAKKERLKSILIVLAFVFTFVLTVGLVYYNSIHYDYQAQGRYVYPVLVPFAISIALLYALDKRFRFVIYLLLFAVMYAFISGVSLFIRSYV